MKSNPTPERESGRLCGKTTSEQEKQTPSPEKQLHNEALRDLFHSPAFNSRDGLDDYDQDFNAYQVLDDVITADMRHQLYRCGPGRQTAKAENIGFEAESVQSFESPGNESGLLVDFENYQNDEMPWLGLSDKTGFVSLVPDLCAHRRSRLPGCSRCITVCPTGAIRSQSDSVEIDGDLCRGCGICAAFCPTGALINGDVPTGELLSKIRSGLKQLRGAAPREASVVFHQSETSYKLLKRIFTESAGALIRLPVENIGSIGMEIWFAALALGAERVILVPGPRATPGLLQAIKTCTGYAGLILEGMGFDSESITLAEEALPGRGDKVPFDRSESRILNPPEDTDNMPDANDKRELMRTAVEHLCEQIRRTRPDISLPAGAPFGTIRIDEEVCTFCMACAQVCPTSALEGGRDRPQINMTEAGCIQCGLCRIACPEKAIELYPRFVYARKVSEAQTTLNEAASVQCISCGKPFAPARLIDKMAARLNNHWMYCGQAEIRRLKMCRDCRLQDIFSRPRKEEIR